MYDPDLPFYIEGKHVSDLIVEALPFDEKLRVMEKYGLSVGETLNIFHNYQSIIEYYEQLCEIQEPAMVYQWVFSHLAGNAAKKSLGIFSLSEEEL
jgi:Asp-tRNA(Asn)/Glu-tRNA(Gln) amidotransferase B subunit